MKTVLGLGSNLGDREANLDRAIAALSAAPGIRVRATSWVYETPPAGGPPQGPYLNGAVLVETDLSPRALLDVCLGVERSLGRIRPDAVRWGPRTIDVDVLWIEGEALDEADLVVPHPRLAERPFAVRPLVDVARDARDPRSGALYADLPAARAAIEKHGDRRAGAPSRAAAAPAATRG